VRKKTRPKIKRTAPVAAAAPSKEAEAEAEEEAGEEEEADPIGRKKKREFSWEPNERVS